MGWLDWDTPEEKALKQGRTRERWIDPNRVRWDNHKVDEQAVEVYMRNPNKTTFLDGDGLPLVVKRKGRLIGINGKHRAVAAMRTGRQLKVRYYEED